MQESLLISGFYAGILAILHIGLTFKIIGLRRSLKIGIGDGENKILNRAIRMQGNFIEQTPITLILLAIFEMNGGSPLMLHICGGVFVASRAIHAMGISRSAGVTWQRKYGSLGTYLVILTLALSNIFNIL